MLARPFHDSVGDKAMFLQRCCKDKNVVEIDGDDTLGDKVFENLVHHRLEGRRAVGQSEVHHERFKQTTIRSKRRFPFIAFFYPHVVIPPADVELGEVLCAFESVDEVVNEGEGIAILSGDQVERAIVLDKAKSSVLLFDEEHRGAYWRFRMPDATRGQSLLEERVKFCLLIGGHWVDLAKPRRRFTLKFDGVVPFPTFREVIKGALTADALDFMQGGGDCVAKRCGF